MPPPAHPKYYGIYKKIYVSFLHDEKLVPGESFHFDTIQVPERPYVSFLPTFLLVGQSSSSTAHPVWKAGATRAAVVGFHGLATGKVDRYCLSTRFAPLPEGGELYTHLGEGFKLVVARRVSQTLLRVQTDPRPGNHRKDGVYLVLVCKAPVGNTIKITTYLYRAECAVVVVFHARRFWHAITIGHVLVHVPCPAARSESLGACQ